MAISRYDLTPLAPAFESGATIIVPSLRIKDAILAEFHNTASNKTYLTPDVVPIDVWVKDQWDKLGFAGVSPFCEWQIVEGAEELFIWTTVIEASRDEIPLLNPIDTAVQVSQSYQDAQQWDIWQPIQSDSKHYTANPDVAVFRRWVMAFHAYCEQRSLLSLVDSIRFLINSCSAGNKLFLPERITLCNFDDPPPLYANLFNALETITEVERVGSTTLNAKLDVNGYKFESRDDEIHACAKWANATITANPDQHIGIITQANIDDTDKINRVFNDYFRSEWILEFASVDPLFNLGSETRVLTDEGFINDALQFLNLFWQDVSSHDVCRLLRSEYLLPQADEASSRMHAELVMRQRFSTSCTQFELAEILDNSKLKSYSPALAKALLSCRTLIRQASNKATPKLAIALFKQLLEEVQWPGEQLSASQKKALQAWDDCLEQFTGFEKSAAKMTYPVLLTKLKQLALKASLRSGFSSRRQLSLYTMSEAQGLYFDRTWLLGFDDQSWPPSASPSPFLPYELQRLYKLPRAHGDVQLAMAAASIASLKSSVKGEMVVSYFASEGDQHFRASGLLGDVALEPMVSPPAWPLNQYSEVIRGKAVSLQCTDLPPPGLHKEEVIKGGQSVISNQSSCPFRAFAKHRLNIAPLEGFSRGLNSLARGIAIHIGLENLYGNFENSHEITELDQPSAQALIAKASKAAISYLQQDYKRVMTPRFAELEETRITALLSLFLNIDRKRIPFDILFQEKNYVWHHGDLRLSIKVDRIDQLNNGALALIDYKTGKSAPKRESWLEDRPEDMQLPFYFAVASASESTPVEALAIAHVNIEKLEYSALVSSDNFMTGIVPIGKDESVSESWGELTSLWQQRVINVADEFIAGESRVDPVNGIKTCQYCRLQPLCRINETATQQNLDDEEFDSSPIRLSEGDY